MFRNFNSKISSMRFSGKYKIALLCIFAVVLLYFSFRSPILRFVFSKVQAKLKNNYALTLEAKTVKFKGFKTVYFQDLKLSQDSNVLLYIDSLALNPRAFAALRGKILFKEIDIQQGTFNFDINHLRNIKKITAQQPSDTLILKVSESVNFSKLTYKLINTYFQYVPSRLNINKFNIAYKRDTLFVSLTLNEFHLKNNSFSGSTYIQDNKISETLLVSGAIDSYNDRISFNIINSEKKSITLPYIQFRWNTMVSFDSISGYFGVESYRSGVLQMKIKSGIHNFIVNNKRIGPDPVITQFGSANLNLNVSERAVEIDSSSTLAFNKIRFSPYFKLEKNPDRKVIFKIIRQEFEADKLLKSFPDGLFDNITKLETKGNLIYSLNFAINLDNPDSALLHSRLEKKDFAILKYGGDDFRKMNGDFRYDAFDRDRFVRSFIIGPENPDFASLDQISPYLKYCILTSEDGDFFYHRGFNENAFRESISKNIKEKRFARGGSTISMQLVKNVFLSRKKTIARKVEEMLIVWMIENLRLTSKDRMFEVYLNIIEWGPDIYGAKEAARFYFNKPASQINLKEGIFLSSIIPRPRGFKYAFDTTGHLRSHYAGYYRLLSGIMLRRNQITPEDTFNLKPDLELVGAAKYYLTKPDTIREDSIFFIEPRGFQLEAMPLKVEETDMNQ